jgi:uncharacterized membrane protein
MPAVLSNYKTLLSTTIEVFYVCITAHNPYSKIHYNSSFLVYDDIRTVQRRGKEHFHLRFKYRFFIILVVLYGCETWSLTPREEHRLRVFENRVLRRIF